METHSKPAPNEGIAITMVDIGVADTGSLALLTTANTPVFDELFILASSGNAATVINPALH